MSAAAERTPPSGTVPVQVAAVRRQVAIDIDGRLNEADWKRAVPATGFLQHDPDEGRPAVERTEVRFLYDDDALYIGARMYDDGGAAGVRTRLVRRDDATTADNLLFVFDTYHDRVGRTVFRIDPSGVQYDALSTGRADPDPAWDAVWESATRVDSLGWTAEIRIPFSQLRLAGSGPQTWGLQIWRFEQRHNETSQWAFWTKREPGGPPYFGHLTGLNPRLGPVSMEALPYASFGVSPRVPDDPNNAHGSHAARAVGADLLLRRSGAAATLTVNPDFGQVEVDPAVLNLTAIETFFPEKRQFFVQDAGVFSFGSVDCFTCRDADPLRLYYSRRVGHPPTLQAPGVVVDAPGATRILGAGRIAVQSRDGWTIGALAARTERETAAVLDSSGRLTSVPVEPATTYLLGRVEKRSTSGELSVGALGAVVSRELASQSPDALASLLPSRAVTGGLDADRWFASHTYHFTATSAVSLISGDSLALQRVENSSTHYFQRSGRRIDTGFFDTRDDPARRTLHGYAGAARFAKDGGAWTWESRGEVVSPGFEANDFGFVPVAGTQSLVANVRRSFTTPRVWYHYADVTAGIESLRNFDGDAIARDYHVAVDVMTPSYWTVSALLLHLPTHYDDRLLRGGPTVAIEAGDSAAAHVETDTRHTLSMASDLWWSADRSADRTMGIAPSLSLRPTDALSLGVGARVERHDLGAQFVSTVIDSTPGASSRRAVTGALRQRTVSLELRANAAVTPRLSLDAYLQPFVTAGAYRDFGEFIAPHSARRLLYGRDIGTAQTSLGTDGVNRITVDPDGAGPEHSFVIVDPSGVAASLRGNAVLRWEYRPGSALYLAWTQTRTDPMSLGAVNIGYGSRALLRLPPINALLLKVTYHVGN
ncbi:MAG: DUF5916 domain-containing protein [Gemmatimonadaceae bacterium]